MKLQLWGLPCSGTTIVCRYFHSLPGAYFLSEPLGRFASSALGSEWELESELRRYGRGASVLGFKECYGPVSRGWFAEWSAKPEWTLIAIVRSPLAVWGSLRTRGWGKPSLELSDFVRVASEFYRLMLGKPAISYESFAEDPGRQVLIASGIASPPGLALRRLKDSSGNPEAHRGARVRRRERREIPPQDRDVIGDSGLLAAHAAVLASSGKGIFA